MLPLEFLYGVVELVGIVGVAIGVGVMFTVYQRVMGGVLL